MNVSRNWIQEYLNFELPPTDELVERIGAQLGAVEGVEDLGVKYAQAVIVKVIECSPLENSDHLNLCYIDDNNVAPEINRREDGLVQVVCGAPNVKAGMLAVWLPPGATVPSTHGAEPFVLEARELRGTVSNGMLASPKELAFGDSHQGLLELDSDAQPGTGFAVAYGLNDVIIDVENKMFTHRPDCFGQLGVAREVAGIMAQPFNSPEWYRQPAPQTDNNSTATQLVGVINEIPELCPRYMLMVIDNITIRPSPVWLQAYLTRAGVRPINNIVDMTNYIMLLTGQPLHAFDFNKVAEDGDAQIIVRNPHSGEELTLLDGKVIKPRAEAILICSPLKPIALGGVMGGNNSEIDETTSRIIIECANFDMYNIRRTSMQHGIFSDAVTRFTKGQSPEQCAVVLAQAVALTLELCPDAAAHEPVDNYPNLHKRPAVPVTRDFINSRLGLDLSTDQMANLLRNVEFEVAVEGDALQVSAPFWRTDIELREDVVEEIGRLHGFDKLPLHLPHRDITPAVQDSQLQLKAKIRTSLAKGGANEALTYSFIHGNLLDRVSQQREQAFKVSNALSPDLQYYRLHALPSLLDKVHMNIKAGYDEFALFELNKGHNLLHADDADGGVPTEIEFLDFVYAAKNPRAGAPFYQARRHLDALAKDFNLTLSYAPIADDPQIPVADPYDHRRSAYVSVKQDGQLLGMVGEFKASVIKNLKLPAYSAGFTIGPDQLALSASKTNSSYQPLPRYPKVEQDICFKVGASLPHAELLQLVTQTMQAIKLPETQLTITTIDIYRRPEETAQQQITFRIGLASFHKTMTDQEMTALLETLSNATSQKFQAERI